LVSFFDPDYVRSLSPGAVWIMLEGSGLSRLGIRVLGTKGLL